MLSKIMRPMGVRKKTISGAGLSGLWIVLCIFNNCLLTPIFVVSPSRPLLVFPLLMACIGCAIAQGSVTAAWLVWSDQSFRHRLFCHWTVLTVLYLAWLLGLALSLPDKLELASSIIGMSIPLLSVAVQLPLWITRQLLGWRLVCEGQSKIVRENPLTIRNLLLATALFAVTIAVALGVPSPDGKEMKTPLSIAFFAAVIFSTFTIVPISFLLLASRRFQPGLFRTYLYATFLIVIPWVIVLIVQNQGFAISPPFAVVVGLSCSVLSFFATSTLAALAARAYGYRLIRDS